MQFTLADNNFNTVIHPDLPYSKTVTDDFKKDKKIILYMNSLT